jgi:hypothetical protein
MKYIVVKVDDGKIPREYPILFPEALVHSEVLDAMKFGIQRSLEKPVKMECVSAGFISCMCIDAVCHGKSESIGISSRDEDDALIKMIDYTHGILP